ncbi:MAG: hypothetical protein AAF485_23990, partial [Chloroflexota bacterium]
MPQITIYRNRNLIETRKVNEHFSIIGNKVLAWQIYEQLRHESGWITDELENKIIEADKPMWQHQMTLLKRMNFYELSPILPNWRLWLDDLECPKGFYNNLDIIWQKVRLHCGRRR